MRATLIARRFVRPTPIARYATPAESQRAAVLASGAQGKPAADAHDEQSPQRQRRRSERPRGDGQGGVVTSSEIGLAVASLLPPLPLYRRLLRAHRVLPIEMKSLGDQYVKDEFRRHRAIDNPLQIVGFLTQWKVYLDGLESSAQGDQFRGKKLDMQQFEKLSEEQMYQLHELLTATRELFDPERAQAQPPGGQKAVSEAVNEALERARQATDEEQKKKGQ